MVRLVALTLLGATSSLPLGGGAPPIQSRPNSPAQFFMRPNRLPREPAAAEGEKAAESAVQAPEPVVAPNEPPVRSCRRALP